MGRVARGLVFTNGVFDILHAGHVRYLQAARRLGDRLIVAINSDDSTRRLKGPTRPINAAIHRREVLQSLRCVDAVLIFDEDTPHRLLRELRPDILCKGGDYTLDGVIGRDVVEGYGGRVVVLPSGLAISTTGILAVCPVHSISS